MPIEELIKAMGWNDPEEEEETLDSENLGRFIAPLETLDHDTRGLEKEENQMYHVVHLVDHDTRGLEEEENQTSHVRTISIEKDEEEEENQNHHVGIISTDHDTRGLQVVDNDSHLEKQAIRELSTQLRNEFRSVEGLLVDSKDYLVELDELIQLRGAILAGAEKKIPLVIIEQGRDLTIRRGLCANHGEWLPYLKQIGIPRTTACRHMRAYAETLCLDAPDKPKKGRTKAEDAERKQKERAYKSSLKAIGNYNYNECVAVLEEAQKRISQLRPQGYQNPPQNTGKQTVTIDANNVQPKKQTVTIDANNVHYFK